MASQYNMCMTSQIVWYSSQQGRVQIKGNVCTVCLCLCAYAGVKLCVLILSVWGCIAVWAYLFALLWQVAMFWLDWGWQVVRVGAAAPWVFLTRNTCVLYECYLVQQWRWKGSVWCWCSPVQSKLWLYVNSFCLYPDYTAAIVGGTVGGGVALIVIIGSIIVCVVGYVFWRNKKKR